MDAQVIRDHLNYDPVTGAVTWKVRLSPSAGAGEIAGAADGLGYRRIGIRRQQFRAHQAAWAIMTGQWPTSQIDHINGDRSDNSWGNLRLATQAINSQNLRRARSDNKSGFLGVSKHGVNWAAQIGHDGKRQRLGSYPTPEKAHAAYLAKKREIHEGCTI